MLYNMSGARGEAKGMQGPRRSMFGPCMCSRAYPPFALALVGFPASLVSSCYFFWCLVCISHISYLLSYFFASCYKIIRIIAVYLFVYISQYCLVLVVSWCSSHYIRYDSLTTYFYCDLCIPSSHTLILLYAVSLNH